MEHLFRLVLQRPPITQDEDLPSVRLAQNSNFQVELGQAQQQEGNRREAMKAAARRFVGTPPFVGDPKNLSLHDPLKKLDAALDELEKQSAVTPADVAKAVKDAFGGTPASLVNGGTLNAPMVSLRDSLIAIKLLPEEQRRPIEDLTNQLRDLELIEKIVADTKFTDSIALLRRYRRRSLLLPSEADLKSALSTAERQKELEAKRKEAEEGKRKDAEDKLDLYRRLKAAIAELTGIGTEHLESTPQVADAGSMVPAQFRATQIAVQELTHHQHLTQLNLLRSRETIGPSGEIRRTVIEERSPAAAAPAVSALAESRGFMVGKGPFTPVAIAATAFRFKPTAERLLSAGTQEILKQRGLSISVDPLDRIVELLRGEVTRLSQNLDELLGRPVHRTFKRVGKAMVMISTPAASLWNQLVTANDLVLTGPLFPPEESVPTSHGTVSAAGVADLLVVKQQLVRYEGADVAHIENVLKSEKKEREHTTRKQTEEFTLRETETTTSEERELESTSRFEMSRESSETIKEDASLKAGLSVSGKYGPSVEFTASAEGAVSRSKEEATRSAATFSQDVTERSATKITERVLERSSLRITNEIVERNLHVLDNVKGTGHIAGVYQWVNKVYQAQMYNYGIRMMYDFMVAEPAAFLIAALQGAHSSAVDIEKPAEFTLRPDQITESNFYSWVKQYGATDVQAPPEMYKTKSMDFNAGGGDDDADYGHSGQIAIDDGYKAVFGVIGIAGNVWEDNAGIDAVLGRRTHRFSGGLGIASWTTSLDEETDSVPIALGSWKYSQITAAIEVKCQRTERALVKWRLETHARLTTAYKARLSEYEEKLAALEVQAGVAIRGRNPFLNLEMMSDELKKHCISILTDQHFDLFGAVQVGAHDVPQLHLPENAAEGPYVRFFEQAFEWEQMTWLTYPYFWGRKSQWFERIAYEDVDPIFNQFLKAGFCRVVVPVRPGFEGAIDHFMTLGEVWNGGPLPTISNPLYLPIADEIAERLDRPGEEIAQGDPWLVRIPTTLVHLRPDDKLPAWKQNAAGEWVEA